MSIKRFLLFFLLLAHCNFAVGQDDYASVKRRVNRIDSLMTMYYSNYDRAEHEADDLYSLLERKYTAKEFKGFKIDVMLQKSTLYSLNGEHHKGLEIALKALDEAEKYKLPEKEYHCCWEIALMYEIGGDYDLCRKYLDKAYVIYKQNKLDSVYSCYCIRISSYYLRVNKSDSAIYYAYIGRDFAQKYHNRRELRDAYLLLGLALPEDRHDEAMQYKRMVAQMFFEIKDFTSAASQLTDIAVELFKHDLIREAFKYSDSAFSILNRTNAYVNPHIYEVRSKLFDAVGRGDSAYYYFRKYHDVYVSELNKMETSRIQKISEQYENDKKETVIHSKNKQILLIVILLLVIVATSVLLIRSNRRINRQNKVINKQLAELTSILEQKQVLLSELQHRVKNNLQHVISILEIQKESVDFNNIDELIRGNQNRIHSMALLHKKLNVSDNVNEVDLKKYLTELAELVKDSYHNHKKKIQLSIKCDVEQFSIEKALPLGLIVVELVSNSIKHAFPRRTSGSIHIEMVKDEAGQVYELTYKDDGIGYDFKLSGDKGLGMEIIKGLLDQLNADVVSKHNSGFELIFRFK